MRTGGKRDTVTTVTLSLFFVSGESTNNPMTGDAARINVTLSTPRSIPLFGIFGPGAGRGRGGAAEVITVRVTQHAVRAHEAECRPLKDCI